MVQILVDLFDFILTGAFRYEKVSPVTRLATFTPILPWKEILCFSWCNIYFYMWKSPEVEVHRKSMLGV